MIVGYHDDIVSGTLHFYQWWRDVKQSSSRSHIWTAENSAHFGNHNSTDRLVTRIYVHHRRSFLVKESDSNGCFLQYVSKSYFVLRRLNSEKRVLHLLVFYIGFGPILELVIRRWDTNNTKGLSLEMCWDLSHPSLGLGRNVKNWRGETFWEFLHFSVFLCKNFLDPFQLQCIWMIVVSQKLKNLSPKHALKAMFMRWFFHLVRYKSMRIMWNLQKRFSTIGVFTPITKSPSYLRWFCVSPKNTTGKKVVTFPIRRLRPAEEKEVKDQLIGWMVGISWDDVWGFSPEKEI